MSSTQNYITLYLHNIFLKNKIVDSYYKRKSGKKKSMDNLNKSQFEKQKQKTKEKKKQKQYME